MSSVNQFVKSAVASAVVLAFVAPGLAGAAVNLAVNRDAQVVQTPAAPAAGISYVQTGANASTLKVYTEGFLFCANGPGAISREATFQPAHEDTYFSPAHPWHFSTVVDVLTAGYADATLNINQATPTTLTCRSVGSTGEVATALSDGIFDNGLDSATETNYRNLVNWLPPSGFSWLTPDWSQVPLNACDSQASPRVVEDIACAALSGVRPDSQSATGVRASTLWTAQDGINFTYLLRIDGRFGPQTAQRPAGLELPAKSSAATDSPSNANLRLRDAYDSTYLSPTVKYCYITTLPTVLTSNVCNGAPQQFTVPLDTNEIVLSPPPLGSGSASFYVAVVRNISNGSHTNSSTPVVAVSVLVDPALVAEGGNRFIGDDVIFGFMPSPNAGFPWMINQ